MARSRRCRLLGGWHRVGAQPARRTQCCVYRVSVPMSHRDSSGMDDRARGSLRADIRGVLGDVSYPLVSMARGKVVKDSN